MKGRTYRYDTHEPQYPFGYGLSYSQFLYRDMDNDAHVYQGDSVNVEVTVRNLGPYEAHEVGIHLPFTQLLHTIFYMIIYQ